MLKNIQLFQDLSFSFIYVKRLLKIDTYLFQRFLRNVDTESYKTYLKQRNRIQYKIYLYLLPTNFN